MQNKISGILSSGGGVTKVLGKRPPDGDEKKMTSSGDATRSPRGESHGHKLGREHEEERAADFSF